MKIQPHKRSIAKMINAVQCHSFILYCPCTVAALAQNCWNCHFDNEITLDGALQDSSKDRIYEYMKKRYVAALLI